ncbi:hypothetical protein K437DRAFT_259589 [Tilletiaria anomala UBC 951]|uniref:Uncharacterized protein n=1 Tax=Tilletiaria anomala (strain ATCC 24038 / CBS 436.72 / UBC 951) TaxID=1037660 RepID=A0A066VCC4_TILAU|nr:uncharacterized protein K437DRAFT_259589 [Tilletiaria anomala UBC 951]KDN37938.1 hypothetical protein K437DRAFT_259589 [Tilletiaria anomala UBC 951]
MCAHGISLLISTRDIVGERLSEDFLGAAEALDSLLQRFNGIAPPSGCRTQTLVQRLLDPLALTTFEEIYLDLLKPSVLPHIGTALRRTRSSQWQMQLSQPPLKLHEPSSCTPDSRVRTV